MTDLKDELAALLASPEGKAMIDAGRKFLTGNCKRRSLKSWRNSTTAKET